MGHKLLLLFLCVSGSWSCAISQNPDTSMRLIELERKQLKFSDPLETISLGSCNRQDKPQVFWPVIARSNPDLWLWLGDNIYGDSEDMNIIAEKYNKQLSNEAYSNFIKNTPVLGTWDDHDFGANNAGEEYAQKRETQQLLLSFLGIPKDNPVWNREGAYYSYSFGPDDKKTKIIFLDSRYHRDAPKIEGRDYITEGFEGDMLGDEQWTWFEREIKDTAALYIIANGTQIIPEDHRYEKWANFPKSRLRLLKNLESAAAHKIILLSGDRHLGEISQMALSNGKIITEMTSSGMTHSYESVGDEPNRHRIGPIMSQKNVGRILINWSEEIMVDLQILDSEGKVFNSLQI